MSNLVKKSVFRPFFGVFLKKSLAFLAHMAYNYNCNKGMKGLAMKYRITIEPNQGYAPDQCRTITVADLMDELQGLEPDAEIVTYDYQNTYGAKWGGLTAELEPVEEED